MVLALMKFIVKALETNNKIIKNLQIVKSDTQLLY